VYQHVCKFHHRLAAPRIHRIQAPPHVSGQATSPLTTPRPFLAPLALPLSSPCPL
jgi:hypothetical protein